MSSISPIDFQTLVNSEYQIEKKKYSDLKILQWSSGFQDINQLAQFLYVNQKGNTGQLDEKDYKHWWRIVSRLEPCGTSIRQDISKKMIKVNKQRSIAALDYEPDLLTIINKTFHERLKRFLWPNCMDNIIKSFMCDKIFRGIKFSSKRRIKDVNHLRNILNQRAINLGFLSDSIMIYKPVEQVIHLIEANDRSFPSVIPNITSIVRDVWTCEWCKSKLSPAHVIPPPINCNNLFDILDYAIKEKAGAFDVYYTIEILQKIFEKLIVMEKERYLEMKRWRIMRWTSRVMNLNGSKTKNKNKMEEKD